MSSLRLQKILDLTMKALTCAILGVIFYVAQQHIASIISWPPKAYQNPSVFNLSEKGVVWDVYYGPASDCGGVDCPLSDQWQADQFTKHMVLPAHEFPLNGYKTGDNIYYKTTVTLPDYLQWTREAVLFHSVTIWAKNFWFYVNGQLVEAGGQRLLNIRIPSQLIEKSRGKLTLAFKIDPGTLRYQGLAHNGSLVIGPTSLLSPLNYIEHDLRTTYYLWHLLPRATLCLTFAFLFLAVARNKEVFVFVLYAIFSSLDIYLVSGLPQEAFGELAGASQAAPVFMILASLTYFFLVNRFYRSTSKSVLTTGIALSSVVLVATVYLTLQVSGGEAHRILNTANYALRVSCCAFAIWKSFSVWKLLRSKGLSPHRQRSAMMFGVFSLVSAVFYGMTLLRLAPSYLGISSVFINDTLTLIVLAAIIGQDFSSTISQRDRVTSNLRQFIGHQIANLVISEKDQVKPHEGTATILFSDIRSFTSLSESMTASEVFSFLNDYFPTMVKVINEHGGVIDKFGGDSIMAVWGIPHLLDHQADKAVQCGLAMREALVAYNLKLKSAGKEPIKIGIGIHTGPVIAGAIGSDHRVEYTVIGDTVNTASRIESLTKDYNIDLLVSKETWTHVQDRFTGIHIADAEVKGKKAPVSVFYLPEQQDKSTILKKAS